MDRSQALLQGLRAKLVKWCGWIEKTAHCTLSLTQLPNGQPGEFSAMVTWRNKDGTVGEYVHPFNRGYVFSGTMHLPSQAWAVRECASWYARDIVRNVLDRRLNT